MNKFKRMSGLVIISLPVCFTPIANAATDIRQVSVNPIVLNDNSISAYRNSGNIVLGVPFERLPKKGGGLTYSISSKETGKILKRGDLYSEFTSVSTAGISEDLNVSIEGGGSVYKKSLSAPTGVDKKDLLEITGILNSAINANASLQDNSSTSAQPEIDKSSFKSSISSFVLGMYGYDKEMYTTAASHKQKITNHKIKIDSIDINSFSGSNVSVTVNIEESFSTKDSSEAKIAIIPGSDSYTDNFSLLKKGKNWLIQSVSPSYIDSSGLPSTAVDASNDEQNELNKSYSSPLKSARVVAMSNGSSKSYNASGAVAWALKHYKDTPYFSDDCTKFVSDALQFGGGLPEVTHVSQIVSSIGGNTNPFDPTAPFNWYFGPEVGYSHTYSVAHDLFTWLTSSNHGRPIVTNQPTIAGDVIFANWGFKGTASGSNGISHAGIVVSVHGGNTYVAQHSNPSNGEPVWRQSDSSGGWQRYAEAKGGKLTVYVVRPLGWAGVSY